MHLFFEMNMKENNKISERKCPNLLEYRSVYFLIGPLSAFLSIGPYGALKLYIVT